MTLQLEFATADYRYKNLRWTEGKPGKSINSPQVPANGTATLASRASEVGD